MIVLFGALWSALPYAAAAWIAADLVRERSRLAPAGLLRAKARPEHWVPLALAVGGAIVAAVPFAARGEIPAIADIVIVSIAPFAARTWAQARLAQPHARRGLAKGLALGLGVLAAVSAAEWVAGALAGSSAPRAHGWLAHPNSWGTAAVVPVLAAIVLRPPVGTAIAAGALGASVVVLSGSRTAALALAIGVAASLPWMSSRLRIVALAALAVGPALLLVSDNALLLRFGWGSGGPENLVGSSEDLRAPEWSPVGVRVEGWWLDGILASVPRRWTIEKVDDPWWARLQQTARLDPGKTYTIEVDLAPAQTGSEPGLHGIASEPAGASLTVVARGSWSDPSWDVESSGALEVVAVASEDLGAGWRRLRATVRVEGAEPVPLRLGIVPDARSRSGARLDVRRYGITEGATGGYTPTFRGGSDARNTRGTLQGRASYLRTAWSGFLASPWLGHGADAFADFDASSDRAYRVDHAHNLLVHALFRAGLVGAIGFVLIGAALALLAPAPSLPLVGAVAAASLLDIAFITPNVGLSFVIAVGIAGGMAADDRARGSGSVR